MEEKIKKAAEEYHNRIAEANDNAEAYDFSGAFIAGAEFALNNQWVSTKERLPKEEFDDGYKFVFVRVKIDDDTFYYDSDYIRNGKWELHDEEITHWMKIPKQST